MEGEAIGREEDDGESQREQRRGQDAVGNEVPKAAAGSQFNRYRATTSQDLVRRPRGASSAMPQAARERSSIVTRKRQPHKKDARKIAPKIAEKIGCSTKPSSQGDRKPGR